MSQISITRTIKKEVDSTALNAAFSTFAKGRTTKKLGTSNCVVYTRVSTKEQADNNMSLETQRKACEKFAEKAGYQILGYFGGTYESAKTDERKQFNAMLSFVKGSRQKVSAIIVYSVDRFSRSGANAIYIAEQLNAQGIVVCSVTQPTDATTPSGRLQQNIQFIFSEYDNQLRREKCMAGVKEKLYAGIWCTAPPRGYDIVRRNGKKEFVLNREGKLISKAFGWRAKGMSNEAVRQKLEEAGLKMSDQRVSNFLRNPFYCGLLVHNALEGQVVEGVQEKAVSKEVFLMVNGLLSEKKTAGYSINPENEEVPLKRFIKCESCGEYLRAYKAWKNQKYYYKCNTKGCNCNKRADSLHGAFKSELAPYSIPANLDTAFLIKRKMSGVYNRLNADKETEKEQVEKSLQEINKKIERLEERFISEEIDRDIFRRYREKFTQERAEIEERLAKSSKGVSNLDKCIEAAIEFSSKLPSLWESGDYIEKQNVQKAVFPDGMYYNRKTDECRTPRVNSVLLYMAGLAQVLEQNKSGETESEFNFPAWVENTGIEPVTSCMPCKRSTK